MAIEFNKILNLSSIDPSRYSINENCEKKEKRSKVINFIRWIVYIVSFTTIPRNKELDRICRSIANVAKARINTSEPLTEQDTTTLKNALTNLIIIIKKNSGKEKKIIENLLLQVPKPFKQADQVKEESRSNEEVKQKNTNESSPKVLKPKTFLHSDPESLGAFSVLPNETMVHLFSFLREQDLGATLQVCRSFYLITNDVISKNFEDIELKKQIADIFKRFQLGIKTEAFPFPPYYEKQEFRLAHSLCRPIMTQIREIFPESFIRKRNKWKPLSNGTPPKLGALELNKSDPHFAFYIDVKKNIRCWLSIIEPKKGQIVASFDTMQDIDPEQMLPPFGVTDPQFTARFPNYNGPPQLPNAVEECWSLVGAHSLNKKQIITVTDTGILRKWDISQTGKPISLGKPSQLFEVFAGYNYTKITETCLYNSFLFVKAVEDDEGFFSTGMKPNSFLRQYDIETGKLIQEYPLTNPSSIAANKQNLLVFEIPHFIGPPSQLKAYKKDVHQNKAMELAWVYPNIPSYFQTFQINDQWIAVYDIDGLLIINASNGKTWWKLPQEFSLTRNFQLIHDLIIFRNKTQNEQSLTILHLPSKQQVSVDLTHFKVNICTKDFIDRFQLNLKNGEIMALFNNSYEMQKNNSSSNTTTVKNQTLLRIIPTK